MNINDMTVGQCREIAELFSVNIGDQQAQQKHAHLAGSKVLAIVPNGFVFIGDLSLTKSGGYILNNASNIRSWKARVGGLPELAKNGYIDGDKIDDVGEVFLEQVLAFYRCGENHE